MATGGAVVANGWGGGGQRVVRWWPTGGADAEAQHDPPTPWLPGWVLVSHEPHALCPWTGTVGLCHLPSSLLGGCCSGEVWAGRSQVDAEAHASTSDTPVRVTSCCCSSGHRDAPGEEEDASRAGSNRRLLVSPGVSPSVETEPELLRAIYNELRELSESMRALDARLTHRTPVQATRAVSVEVAQALLGCGRSQLFALLKFGASSRASKASKLVTEPERWTATVCGSSQDKT